MHSIITGGNQMGRHAQPSGVWFAPEIVTEENRFMKIQSETLQNAYFADLNLQYWLADLRHRGADVIETYKKIEEIERRAFLDVKKIHDDLQSSLREYSKQWQKESQGGQLASDIEQMLLAETKLLTYNADRRFFDAIKEIGSLVRPIEEATPKSKPRRSG